LKVLLVARQVRSDLPFDLLSRSRLGNNIHHKQGPVLVVLAVLAVLAVALVLMS
jgi:hypothetical protein